MNLLDTTTRTVRSTTEAASNVVAFTPKSRRSYGERRFGVGYGNSSGYAADKRYTTDWGQIRFRCA
jgi:hypothetical protein